MGIGLSYLAAAGVAKALVTADDLSASVAAGAGPIAHVTGRDDAVAILNAGAATAGTTPTLDVALYESDDQATWTPVPNGAFATVTDAGPSVQTLAFRPGERKPYLTAQVTVGGSGAAFPVLSVTVLYLPFGSLADPLMATESGAPIATEAGAPIATEGQ